MRGEWKKGISHILQLLKNKGLKFQLPFINEGSKYNIVEIIVENYNIGNFGKNVTYPLFPDPFKMYLISLTYVFCLFVCWFFFVCFQLIGVSVSCATKVSPGEL